MTCRRSRLGLTLSQTRNFTHFQTEEFADDYFKIDENGGQFSTWVENTMRNREIARSEQFLLFPQCFQKTCIADKFGKGLKRVPKSIQHQSINLTRCFNPLPDDKILDWSKLKQFAYDNFEFDVNSRKFSKLVENTVGKGEIARYEQYLFFPQCFQKACFPRASKGVIEWEWVK